MIINFSVKNFGSIKDKQVLSFEADKSKHLEDYYVIHTVGNIRLLKLGLIYGANASGKTTILKALDFLRDLIVAPHVKKSRQLEFTPFLFDPNTPHQNTEFSIEFIQNEKKYAYWVEFNRNAIVNEKLDCWNPKKANIFTRTTEIESQFSKISFGSTVKMQKAFEHTLESNTIWNNTVLGGFLKTNIESKELKEVTEWFQGYLNPLIATNTNLNDLISDKIENAQINKNGVIEILKNADFNISDLHLSREFPNIGVKLLAIVVSKLANHDTEDLEKLANTPVKKIEFEHTINGKSYTLAFKDESQGTQRYYGFAGLLSMLVNQSICMPIDELESSLHPDLFTHFLLSFLMNTKSSQIIATTHNREILNNRDIFRNDAIWITQKSDESATELYSLADFDSSVIRDSSNIFNAYKSGKLGGVPNTGNYLMDAYEK